MSHSLLPRRFELVIGADGVGSGGRCVAFGPDDQFLHVIGGLHVATFGMPNFLGLERWQVMYQAPDAYVLRNQDIALEQDAKPDEPSAEPAGRIPDFGALTLPFALKSYHELVEHPR